MSMELNETQKEAVLQTEGPLLLLASPGSGKTTTIIKRIGYLIEEKGIPPRRIKAVTFSRASAQDMKERFKTLYPQLTPVDFSTIHSLAFEVVREHFRRIQTPFQIIEGEGNSAEQEPLSSEQQPPLHKKIILRNLYKANAGENITDDQLDELTTYISYIKNKMIPSEQWSAVKVEVPQAERILRDYELFKQSGTRSLLLDYDDMLVVCERILAENDGVLRRYQERYDYVLTDESQDTSRVQHAIIEKLVQRHHNLCVVADDDQSLYSWRGADPAYLLNFKQVYPDARILFMQQNYRSSKEIVEIANTFIQRNQDRYPKNMFTQNPPCKPIEIRSLDDYGDQAKWLVQEIQQIENLAEVAVLYRNNSSSIALMNAFDRAGIPFYMKDADNRFFSHWVVEDILNFMRMTFTDKRPDILEKIHLKFNGYISKQQMAALLEIHNDESVFDNLLNRVPVQEYQVKQLTMCKETFQEMKGMPPQPAIQVIRDRLGYEKALEKMCERLGFRKEYLIGILNTLEEIAAGLSTMEEFAGRLKYLEAALRTARSKRGQNVVTFSTMHSSKGLEFERVYMIDLVEGILPSKDDKGNPEMMEEATRLFYVGMTRAKRHLELISYKKRDGAEATESRFVTAVRSIQHPPQEPIPSPRIPAPPEVNPNAIRSESELIEGGAVLHRAFGLGVIEKVTPERIHIRFEAEEKALSTRTCLDMGLLEKTSD
ncbi:MULTISPECIES: ATP-dependent helicase [Paenibacillus]|uniref:ATP-dependent helicase n=1 Tax=Paenibacillus TaxID=44249 RepID=UPI00073EBA63|nr:MULTISPECIES: ATP-dependent helicase [Paenibacillus]MDU4696562.1 ATP-dependent helicase [Paenibacillus sp.]